MIVDAWFQFAPNCFGESLLYETSAEILDI